MKRFHSIRQSATGGTSSTTSSMATNVDSQGVVGIAATDYARKCAELTELHKDLTDLGVSSFFDFPRIVVIGSQSAGKSSLVEAISGIKVPREDDTCTRCPMVCSLSSRGTSWSCKISLQCVDGSGVIQVTPFSDTLKEVKDTEIWLRRAQSAILNPHLPSAEFHNKTARELKDIAKDRRCLEFSKNVVLVDICDPTSTNLNFVDLPGLIQNETDELVGLVKDLTLEYISAEKTIILMTIPINDDMKNQAAPKYALMKDAKRERTIGVLTKPDMLIGGATGAIESWKKVLQGEKDALSHGYYCVRLPSDVERAKYTRKEFQQRAATFFESTAPWNTVSDRSRFGIPELVSYTSKLLLGMIEDILPRLKQAVEQELVTCKAALDKLPPIVADSDDPTVGVLLRVARFCDDFEAAVKGSKHKELAQKCRERYSLLRCVIYNTTLDFRPFKDPFNHSSDSGVLAELVPNVRTITNPGSEIIGLLEVREVIRQSIAWELPHHIPFDATKVLISRSTSRWEDPSVSCFEDIFDIVALAINDLLRDQFRYFEKLRSYISLIVRAEMGVCGEETLKSIHKVLQREQSPFYTQNTEYLDTLRKAWLCHYNAVHWRVLYPHEYTEELAVMAKVKAYFQVAYNRVVDNVPLIIEHELTQALANRLQKKLFEALLQESDVSGHMKDLLSEDKEIVAQRESLTRRFGQLRGMKDKINAFERRFPLTPTA